MLPDSRNQKGERQGEKDNRKTKDEVRKYRKLKPKREYSRYALSAGSSATENTYHPTTSNHVGTW